MSDEKRIRFIKTNDLFCWKIGDIRTIKSGYEGHGYKYPFEGIELEWPGFLYMDVDHGDGFGHELFLDPIWLHKKGYIEYLGERDE